eukprot:Hpha_TRINITY_DN13147_c0_g1::TRINITY_DN13147_c0_g1_i1::g.113780::m.113780
MRLAPPPISVLYHRGTGRRRLRVRMWNDEKGFGFIHGDDPNFRDIFVSRHCIGGGSLTVGERIRFDAAPRPQGQGLIARNVAGPAITELGKAGAALAGFVDPTLKKAKWDVPKMRVPKEKTEDGKKVCEFFWKSGICKKEERCAFAHVKPPPDAWDEDA